LKAESYVLRGSVNSASAQTFLSRGSSFWGAICGGTCREGLRQHAIHRRCIKVLLRCDSRVTSAHNVGDRDGSDDGNNRDNHEEFDQAEGLIEFSFEDVCFHNRGILAQAVAAAKCPDCVFFDGENL